MPGIFNFTKKFNDINTKNKLLIYYFVAVFLPIAIVGIFLTSSMREMALDGAVREASVNVDRIKKRISEVLRTPIEISNRLYIDSKLGQIAITKFKSPIDVTETYFNYRDELENYWRADTDHIDDVRFYAPNDTLLENWRFFKATKEIRESDWYRSAARNRYKVTWNYIYNDLDINHIGYKLSLTRLIMSDGKPAGVLVIEVDRDIINSFLRQEPFETMVINNNGVIIAAKDSDMVGKMEKDYSIDSSSMSEKEIYDITFKNEPAKAVIDSLRMEGENGEFRVISVFPVEKILSTANRTSAFGFSILGISLVVSVALIFIFSGALTKRIKRLSKDMDMVAMGNFDFTSNIDGNDEIGSLARNLEKMVKSIKELVHEVYEANLQKKHLELKQKEIKLQMLANQVNPHFLFNALETIRMKAICNGEDEIAGVVKMLGNLLRRNLEAGSDAINLTTELKFIKDYLEIQKFRFGEKIVYEINIEHGLEEYNILPLLIQPVVENAVIHGIEGLADNGIIRINISRDKNLVLIAVLDNGMGMDEVRLNYVVDSLDSTEEGAGKRIGLRNVHQRIKLFYGEEYGLSIYSKPDEGTRIDIALPWRG